MARRIYRGLAKAMLLATAIVVIIIVAAALAYLMSHTHESITKPSLSTTTTSTSLNALLTRYSSPNFVMHAINGNAIVISNYDENVTLKIPVSRVVAMNTVALQILIDIGAGGDVVGIEGYASQLPWLFGNYTALPAVSSGMWSVNYEEIVSLSPDLVITWSYILPQVRQKLGVFNIPVIAWGSNDNLTSLIIALGVATNHTGKALALINWMDELKQEISSYQAQVVEHPRAYIIFAWEYSPWFVAGNGSDPYTTALMAGLQPCFNESMMVQPEAVLKCNPNVIIAVTWNLDPHAPNATQYCEGIINSIRSNPVLNQTAAVKEDHVIVIPGYLTEGPPRYAVILYIDSVLWPNIVHVNATNVLNQYFSEFLTTAEPGGVWWCSG